MSNISFYAPIDKADDELRMVYGYASTEALDSQNEIVTKDAMKKAIGDYMKFANIREMHQPSAVGKTKQATIDKKGLYIAAKVVDDKAWEKVKEGVYNGFSIGGRIIQQIDNEITDLKLSEISLVDRPANPEAVFDVFKLDKDDKPLLSKDAVVEDIEIEEEKEPEDTVVEPTETGEEVVEEKAEKVDIKKDVYGADFLIDLACNLAMFIEGEKYQKEDSSKLEAALKSIKIAITSELKEDEYFDSITMDNIQYAEKVLDLAKAEDDTKEVEPTEETVDEKVEEKSEEVVEEKAETTEEEVIEESEEVTFIKSIDEKIKTGAMPTDEELVKLLTNSEIEPNEKNISVLKFDLAGKIIDHIQATMKENAQSDEKKADLEKVQKETQKPVVEVKHQFDEVLVLVNKLEDEMKKTTSKDAPALPQSQEQPESPAETTNAALELLRQAVALLTQSGGGNQLTASEEEKLRNGVVAGSEVTSQGRVKAEETNDLEKMETEITSLKEEIKKLQDTPMPIKAVASYTIEKSFVGNNGVDDPKVELQKAEARADEIHELFKQGETPELKKEAQDLSVKIMKLRRELA